MREIQVTGYLKYDFCATASGSIQLGAASRADRDASGVGRRWNLSGEEEIAMAAHRQLTLLFPDLLTVIVPHNPKRGFEIAQSAVKMKTDGGAARRRS